MPGTGRIDLAFQDGFVPCLALPAKMTMSENDAAAPAKITRSEWVIVFGVIMVLLGLTAVPYLLAYTTTQPDTVFMGILMNPEDSQTYFAKMLQGLDGHWRYTITFTAESHEPAFLGGFYFLLGHIARWTGWSLEAVWYVSRILSVVVLLVVAYGFIAYFVPDRRTRLTAYLLAVFSAGLGWLLFVLGQPYWLGAFPLDFKMPEAHLFFMSLTFPHIILSTAVILGSFYSVLRAYDYKNQKKGWGFALAAGLLNLCLGILHPLMIYVVILTNSLYWLVLAWRARRILWYEGWVLVVAYALPGLLYLYYGYSLLTNDMLRGWDANSNQSAAITRPWPHYFVAFGPYILLALIFGMQQRQQTMPEKGKWTFLWMWLWAVLILLFIPLNSQRRIIQGVHMPLSILAAAGFVQVVVPWLLATRAVRRLLTNPRYTAVKLSRFITAVFLLIMALSNLYILASTSVSAVIQQPDPLFRTADEVAAVAWLRAENGMSPAPVLLGDYQTGNLVAARAGNQVVVGHWAETIRYADKLAEVAQFYRGETADTWRQALLAQYNVAYVWHGPREQRLGSFSPETAVYLHPVYQNETITIYTVVE